MAAGKYDLFLEQGVTFRMRITIKIGDPAVVVDLTGYTAKMQFRAAASATSPVILTASSEASPPATSLTMGGSDGYIDLLISAGDTDTLAANQLKCLYDLEIYAPVSGDVTRVLKGAVVIDAEVTR